MKSLRDLIYESISNSSNINTIISKFEYLYHATPACYVNSIKKFGLGGKLPKVRFWEYDDTEYKDIKQGCFLATDEYVAESYVETSESFEELAEEYEDKYGKELEIVVFQIKVSDLDKKLLTIDTNQIPDEDTDPTFFYKGVIPYKNLKKMKL